MKKLFSLVFILASLIIFSSCEFEKEYSVRCDVDYVDKISVCEYSKNNERIHIQTLNNPQQGKTYHFTAKTQTERVKLKVEVYGSSEWVQEVFYLDDITEIVINGETLVGNKEP